jgi:riboflavin synthase
MGDPVNLEADLLAKYTERLLAVANPTAISSEISSEISTAWLAEHGWG